MSNFFRTLINYNNLYNEWASILDWLFDDGKFSDKSIWTKGKVASLTKKVKRFEKFSVGETYIYDSIKNLNFPDERSDDILVISSKGDSESKELIRHIRNGIAHGKAELFCNKGELYVEIKDYKDSSKKQQTAYICFPMSYIGRILKIYNEIQSSIKNVKPNKGTRRSK